MLQLKPKVSKTLVGDTLEEHLQPLLELRHFCPVQLQIFFFLRKSKLAEKIMSDLCVRHSRCE